MILNRKNIRLFFVLMLFAACSADVNNLSTNIAGYDYAHKKQIELEHPLKEISGMAYHTASNTFLAINDEKGVIYVLEPKTFRITNKYPFGEAGDYEEIQVYENEVYVLRSDGVIYKMIFDGAAISKVETFEYNGPQVREYESFYIDIVSNTIVLIPKHIKGGTKANGLISHTISMLDGRSAEKKEHTLSWNDLKSSTILHPSAAAIHPVSKDIYLLASIEKRLIVLNADWKILAEYELDRSDFQQPEGITFDSEATLYITNEAGEKSPTVIQIPILANK